MVTQIGFFRCNVILWPNPINMNKRTTIIRRIHRRFFYLSPSWEKYSPLCAHHTPGSPPPLSAASDAESRVLWPFGWSAGHIEITCEMEYPAVECRAEVYVLYTFSWCYFLILEIHTNPKISWYYTGYDFYMTDQNTQLRTVITLFTALLKYCNTKHNTEK